MDSNSKEIDFKTSPSDHRIIISKGLIEDNEVKIIIKPSSSRTKQCTKMEEANENVLQDYESKRIEHHLDPDSSNRMAQD